MLFPPNMTLNDTQGEGGKKSCLETWKVQKAWRFGVSKREPRAWSIRKQSQFKSKLE